MIFQVPSNPNHSMNSSSLLSTFYVSLPLSSEKSLPDIAEDYICIIARFVSNFFPSTYKALSHDLFEGIIWANRLSWVLLPLELTIHHEDSTQAWYLPAGLLGSFVMNWERMVVDICISGLQDVQVSRYLCLTFALALYHQSSSCNLISKKPQTKLVKNTWGSRCESRVSVGVKMDPEGAPQQAPAMKYKFSANILCLQLRQSMSPEYQRSEQEWAAPRRVFEYGPVV